MKQVLNFEVPYPIESIVETAPDGVRLRFDFVHDQETHTWSIIFNPTDTVQLAVALQVAALHHIRKGNS